MSAALLSVFSLVAVIGIVLTDSAYAGGGPRGVAVVINTRSAVSREIGRYYQEARNIPDSNIINISCPEHEIFSAEDFEKLVETPLRQFMRRPDVAGKIDYVVLTKGTPLGVIYGDPANPHSAASVLTCLDHPEMAATIANPYGPTSWMTWGFLAPEVAWSHSLSFNGYRFYLVTRLDAFTVEQVKALIDRGVRPALDGAFVLDRNTYTSGPYGAANKRLGDQLGSAYSTLVGSGHEVCYDAGGSFIANRCGLMGYFSWASHDIAYTFEKYVSNQFVPGAIGDTYYSYSARTFQDPQTTARPPLIADLIPRGLCGAGGYVSEPQVTTATYANVLFDRYIKGFNLAESFYAACPQLFWKTVVIGDPLMAPYATPPEVHIQLANAVLSGVVTVCAEAADESGVSRVEFYLDDTPIGIVTEPPYEVQLDTTDYPIGPHTIEAIAFENSPVATQGSARVGVTIDNPVSAVAQMSDVFQYPDGQMVRIDRKVVTAGTEDIGGAFYVEELDRSSAIRVAGDFTVARGDLVTVAGTLRTFEGDRVLDGSLVTVVETGAVVPRPLMVRLCDLGGAAAGGSTLPVGPGFGLRNVSLLVKVVGRVVDVGEDCFYISDGSTARPVRVVCPGVAPPQVGQAAAVTGICAVELEESVCRAAIRARDAADIQVL